MDLPTLEEFVRLIALVAGLGWVVGTVFAVPTMPTRPNGYLTRGSEIAIIAGFVLGFGVVCCALWWPA